MICSKCGAVINENDKYCCNCGEAVNIVIYCNKCGTKNNKDSKFCVNCGNVLSINNNIKPFSTPYDNKINNVLVYGLISVFFCWIPILPIVLSIKGISIHNKWKKYLNFGDVSLANSSLNSIYNFSQINFGYVSCIVGLILSIICLPISIILLLSFAFGIAVLSYV